MEWIKSRSNPKIKLVRSLHQQKARQENRLFLVEGIRHVGEAVASEASIEAVYYAPELLKSKFAFDLIAQASTTGTPCIPVAADVFDSVAEKENPQGILAVVHQWENRLEELSPDKFPWGVALVAPQDPGNLGAILRTIDAAGASGLILLDSSVDLYHPSAVRASMGALFWCPVVHSSFSDFASWTVAHHYHVYGSSARADRDYLEAKPYRTPRILLMGSERDGLTIEQKGICEMVVGLPMRGRSSSLNLAVAAGILLYAMSE